MARTTPPPDEPPTPVFEAAEAAADGPEPANPETVTGHTIELGGYAGNDVIS